MNKLFLIGNLTRDPELTETTNGTKVCRFTIAVNRAYSGANGEKQTDFFNCVAWRGLGETVARYLHKGNKVAVSGSIEFRNYEDSDGVKRTAADVVAQDVEFLVTRNEEKQSEDKRKPLLEPMDDDTDIPF